MLSIDEVANELAQRLTRIFLMDDTGRRPVFNHDEKMQRDPHFRDHVLFYEYFHGDTGRGVGASHQTGWTGLIAKLLMPRYSHVAAEEETETPATDTKPLAAKARLPRVADGR
jgi:hypothetical protein